MKDWKKCSIQTLAFLILATLMVLGVVCYRENQALFYGYLVGHGFKDTSFLDVQTFVLPIGLFILLVVYAFFVFCFYIGRKTKKERVDAVVWRALAHAGGLLAAWGYSQWVLFQVTEEIPTYGIQWLTLVLYSLMALLFLMLVIYRRKELREGWQACIRTLASSREKQKREEEVLSENVPPLVTSDMEEAILLDKQEAASKVEDVASVVAVPEEFLEKHVPGNLQDYIQNEACHFNGNALIRMHEPPWLDVEAIIQQSYPTKHSTAYYLGDQPESLDHLLVLASQLPDKQIDVYIPFALITFSTYQNASYLLSFLSKNQPQNIRFIFIQSIPDYNTSVAVDTKRFDQFLREHFTYLIEEEKISLL
ncbi:hypothetical protein [Listeria newyorkensis]|uniref:hypothetical protein n=1 Tax=Listeria newyorkensis TaxID=1497681 RepID=UPI00051D44B7|nr:hypothetical protein [Listeria newyorkensis]KGL43629.1 hypothetical protein EP58_07785 [Listeria newyorkensis]